MNAFTADGMAIKSVVKTKTDPIKGFIPVTNMWWPQTMKLKKPMAKLEPIIARYPKIGFLELVEIISEVIPKAGSKTI